MSKLGLHKQLNSFRRGQRALMKSLAVNSKEFFQRRNFNEQAFVDTPRRRWAKLKKPRPGLILVKTGKLRKSAKARVSGSTRAIVEFKAPYASFHNEGAGRLPQRQFSGESRILNRQNEKILLTYTKRKLR